MRKTILYINRSLRQKNCDITEKEVKYMAKLPKSPRACIKAISVCKRKIRAIEKRKRTLAKAKKKPARRSKAKKKKKR